MDATTPTGGMELAATEFVFIAEKTGKYRLTFDSGIEQYTFEVTETK
jgi:hypothetical protein